MKKHIINIVAAGLLCFGLPLAAFALDPALKPYTPVQGVSGSLKTIGSDSMNNQLALWAEGFLSFYPNVTIEIEGKGSGTAPPALISGTAHFGPMSRSMKASEVDSFVKRFGYPPTQINTSIDMLAVYVHKDNPVKCLTLQQVDAIFSKTRRGGHPQTIRTWGDLGMTGQFANLPISLYGRNSASGTYGFFKKNALFGGDYKDEVKEQPGSSSVVQGVASELAGIGYSGIGYMTPDVRAVPLATGPGEKCVAAVPENAYTGEYPLARFLMMYANYQPGSQLDPLRREFLRYVFSRNGQEDVVRAGYFPVSNIIAQEQLQNLGIK